MNEEVKKEESNTYDLEDRLLSYGASIIQLTQNMGKNHAQLHIAKQLLRSGTAPLSHHGEAQGAESPADFIHKLSLGLKELRESERWLKLSKRARFLAENSILDTLLKETDELIRIFAASIRTARSRNN